MGLKTYDKWPDGSTTIDKVHWTSGDDYCIEQEKASQEDNQTPPVEDGDNLGLKIALRPIKQFTILRAEFPSEIVDELNSVPGFNCPVPGGAFYAFPNITGTNIGSMDLQNKLLNEAGVATISGTSFGALGEGYLRFSYANSAENIIEAIRRVKEYI